MASYKQRLLDFEELFKSEPIDLKNLRKETFTGCPHENSIRSKCWKILLNYLPLEKTKWKTHLQKQRQLYKQFIDEMVVQPGVKHHGSDSRIDVTQEDHPLNPNPDSQWSQYFKDNEMLLQIYKDCRRLCPDLAFFQSATPFPCEELVKPKFGMETLKTRVEQTVLKSQNVSKNRLGITTADYKQKKQPINDYVVLPQGQEAHWEVAERILFIYAKLNPGQGYVQGMNEIIGPIYYTYSTDPDLDCQSNAEADAFWCFTNMMSEIRDNFIKHLDDSDCGIGMLMGRFVAMVKEKDTPLWLKLQEQDMKPQYYAFRWLTLLLSQEFPLPDVLRLWDSLLADESRFDFLISVCCAMLILVREDLLKGDFSANMKLVQSFPSMDIHNVLSKAAELAGKR